ncbi:hypothetical protein DY000_02040348 [Brassica cretica]|uniref:Uncharacterized protein n=1 Tax=Brassica cretica TaxID=69181 RepID=A0ABQ7BHG4_BRACR|nr:hypothetical protein DY000_02040348 [Brassica cretica]
MAPPNHLLDSEIPQKPKSETGLRGDGETPVSSRRGDRETMMYVADGTIEVNFGELVEIKSYIARRPEASISIDRRKNKSIDTNHSTSIDSDTNRGWLVPKTTSDMSNTPYHGKEISADTYAAITRHEFNLESLGDKLQRIENTTAAMKDKWRRGDEAMRDFTGT